MFEGALAQGRADLLDFARTEGYTGKNDERKIVSFLNEAIAEDEFVFVYVDNTLYYYHESYAEDVLSP